MLSLLVLLPFVQSALSACTGTISSLSDIAAAVQCTTVNINSFTVPAGQGFEIDLLDGTTVNLSQSPLLFTNII